MNDEVLKALKEAQPSWMQRGLQPAPFRDVVVPDYRQAGLMRTQSGDDPTSSAGREDQVDWPKSGGTFDHPFKVLSRKNGSNWQFGVYYFSRLHRSLVPGDNIAISGLLSEDQSTGWFTAGSGDVVWLKVNFNSDYNPTSASITQDGSLSAPPWSSDSILEKNSENKQTIARKAIAIIADDGEVDQRVFTHLALTWMCVDGFSAKYPLPT